MAYRDFTYLEVKRRFALNVVSNTDLFASTASVEPSERLRETLEENLPWALAVSTEKARSELLVTPILSELRRALERRISIFSGSDFTVDSSLGLAGFCDFIVSRSPDQLAITAPVAVIVEAKNDTLKNGIGQCLAGMIAAQTFNEREGTPTDCIHGAVTTGTNWLFLRLCGTDAWVDRTEHHIENVAKILGILIAISQSGATGTMPV